MVTRYYTTHAFDFIHLMVDGAVYNTDADLSL